MSSDVAIKVENLSKCYQIYEQPRDRLKQFILPPFQCLIKGTSRRYFREFWALQDLSFEVRKGETVGIIGRNGSGKSSLLQLICGTLNPTKGSVQTNGRIAALLELGSGFNPEFTGSENVYLNAKVLGLSDEEIDDRYDNIVAFSEIGDFINQPVKTYSSGMLVRLAFAVAINVQPEILVVDEALSVGDAAFQRKCLRSIDELSANGVTLLFVSHDTETVKKICSRALYLSRGVLVETGRAQDVCRSYERDLFGAGRLTVVRSGDAEGSEHGSARALLDQELLHADEKVYGDGRAQIDKISITNLYGEKVNVIESAVEVIVSYRVNFLHDATRPIFGMMITNKEGICVFGTNTEGHSLSQRTYSSGEKVKIEFHLHNNLGPGIYYLTCGIHSSDDSGQLVYLQRRMDALIFKCLIAEGAYIGGSANLYPRIRSNTEEECNEM